MAAWHLTMRRGLDHGLDLWTIFNGTTTSEAMLNPHFNIIRHTNDCTQELKRIGRAIWVKVGHRGQKGSATSKFCDHFRNTILTDVRIVVQKPYLSYKSTRQGTDKTS